MFDGPETALGNDENTQNSDLDNEITKCGTSCNINNLSYAILFLFKSKYCCIKLTMPVTTVLP